MLEQSKSAGFISLLEAAVVAGGGEVGDIYQLAESPEGQRLIAQLAGLIVGFAHTPSLEELITKSGFDRVGELISSSHFPPSGKVANVKDMLVVYQETLVPGRHERMTLEEILIVLKCLRYRPATIYELLIWAKENWDGRDRVFALDSPYIEGTEHALPYTFATGDGRALLLLEWVTRATQLETGWKFLLVRNR